MAIGPLLHEGTSATKQAIILRRIAQKATAQALLGTRRILPIGLLREYAHHMTKIVMCKYIIYDYISH